MASGTGNHQIAAVAFVFFTLTLFALTKSQFGKFSAFDYLLTFHSITKLKSISPHLKIFDKYLVDHLLLSLRSTTKAAQVVYTYNIRFKDKQNIKEFLEKLKQTKATHIELISSENDIDY